MDRSSQRVAAAFAPMQERQGLRSRAARRLDLVQCGSGIAPALAAPSVVEKEKRACSVRGQPIAPLLVQGPRVKRRVRGCRG